jgi:hypothetical protein
MFKSHSECGGCTGRSQTPVSQAAWGKFVCSSVPDNDNNLEAHWNELACAHYIGGLVGFVSVSPIMESALRPEHTSGRQDLTTPNDGTRQTPSAPNAEQSSRMTSMWRGRSAFRSFVVSSSPERLRTPTHRATMRGTNAWHGQREQPTVERGTNRPDFTMHLQSRAGC